MSEDPTSSRSQLRQEAAEWFVIMRGPDAEMHRGTFEKWLKRDALHRRAYNSVSETFTLGKLLKDEHSPVSTQTPRTMRPKIGAANRLKAQTIGAVLALGVGVSAAALSWHALNTRSVPDRATADGRAGSDVEARYATAIGEVRNFALPGGTRVILDTDSLVLASFTPSESSLRLIKGRARFFADTAGPKMVVRADTIMIQAKNAIYDVALATGTHVAVSPITGEVEVQYGTDPFARSSSSAQRSTVATTRIGAGDRMELEAGKQTSTIAADGGRDDWPDGVEQFNAIPLSRLVDDANRYTVKPIRLGDAGLADLKISGTFHLADTKRLARQIAQLLALQTDDKRDAFLLRPGCLQNTARPCPAPS